jgi:AcrR family transcriptional regulator
MTSAVTMADPDVLGRRERKKLATRTALVDAALGLFVVQGVEATTVEDIAEAADVSVRTFHRYFAGKEDVLFADSAERRAAFAGFLTGRPSGEPLLVTLRAAAGELAEWGQRTDPEGERLRMRLVLRSESLQAERLRQSDQLSRLVADHCASRRAKEPEAMLPQLLGACTIAAFRTAFERWLADPSVDCRREIDRCFEILADLRAATGGREGHTEP